MAHFGTSGKEYSEAIDLPAFGALNVTISMAGTSVEQTAPASLPDAGGGTRGFLFWDTGRRITGKRTVRWTFNHPENWSDWRAAAWYGTGGGGTGQPLVSAATHWVGVSPIAPTPIDGPGSSFVNGPGGTPLAWPWSGDDHLVRTQWGPATIHALAHLRRSAGDPLLDFSSWMQLVYGGDDSSYFPENDDDITAGSGITGIASVTSPNFPEAMGAGGLLLAGYVTPRAHDYGGLAGRLREVIAGSVLGKFIDKGDPSPEDLIRLKLINESIDLVRGGRTTAGDAFEALLGAARTMNAAELRRSITGTRATLLRGQAALKSLESLAAKKGPAAKAAAPKKRGR